MAKQKLPLKERLERAILVDLCTGCWEWQLAIKKQSGYGQIKLDGKCQLAHRVVYEFMRGLIPDGLVLDHLCRNRACCNPDHLEPVTCSINIRRGAGAQRLGDYHRSKTHCLRGHTYNEHNTSYVKTRTGIGRVCKVCRKIRRSST